jgi:hypothetical protein
VPSTKGCIVTMKRTTFVSATFTDPSDPSDCGPDTRCGEVTPKTPFKVEIYGAGTVLAPKVANIARTRCDAYGAAGFSCSTFGGPRDHWMTLKAFPRGNKFLGWGGACSGTDPTCRFLVRSTPVTIKASFG